MGKRKVVDKDLDEKLQLLYQKLGYWIIRLDANRPRHKTLRGILELIDQIANRDRGDT